MMWAVAYTFHFSPESIGDMTVQELKFWNQGIGWINEQMKRK